ncbi:MAG TPA: dTMP kinase, partial [Candidatus Woesearchaeota archaeon]|nr:dTMP kinase [Candidatus Woesearchaeota archaeon]
LEKGTHILCDRYKHSTLAYQTTQGMDFERLKEMHKGMLIPDLTLIFDCPARIAFERREQAGATDVFDKDLEFQEKLRQNYLKLKEKLAGEKIIIIDATRTPKEIFSEVKKEIKKIL